MKIFTVADVNEKLTTDWLQHLRNFDTEHPGCHFEVMGDAPDRSLSEIVEMMTINPNLSFTEVFERRPTTLEKLERFTIGALVRAIVRVALNNAMPKHRLMEIMSDEYDIQRNNRLSTQ